MSPMNNRLLRPTNNYDADALRYINAVQVADGQALEPEVRTAIDAFVRGCKSDSAGYAGDPTRTVWDALQACCIMCGARTISGALVPLKGTAPTPYNFAGGDYSRSGGGLKGDGSTKYLDSNYAFPSDLQNDMHLSAYAVEQPASIGFFLTGSYVASGSFPNISITSSATEAIAVLARSPFSGVAQISVSDANGFVGANRASSSIVDIRAGGTQEADASPSSGVTAINQYIFARNLLGTAGSLFAGRVAFYSLGNSLDLAALDNRVSTLVAAIAAAI